MQPIQWFVTADARRASLFCCRTIPLGRVHVDRVRHIESEFEESEDHVRPPAPPGVTAVDAAGHHQEVDHHPEESDARFASDVARWLARALRELEVDRVTVFVAPRFLSVLRAAIGGMAVPFELREGEFTHLRAHELAEHATVLRALETFHAVALG